MLRGAMAQVDVKLGIKSILSRVESAYSRRAPTIQTQKPILVAVSKTKPAPAILEAYSVGQRHFGENYIDELVEKATNERLLKECAEIQWHFIGHLQSNKVKKVINLPGLYMIETIDSEKLANKVDKAWEAVDKPNKLPLNVMLQINTSHENVKNGINPSEVIELFRHIRDKCKNLELKGLMTIGRFGHDYTVGPNPDFECLVQCHTNVCQAFSLSPAEVQLSMGMSDDFEYAIEAGSTNVRVGSSIFGYRPKKNEGNSNANDANGSN